MKSPFKIPFLKDLFSYGIAAAISKGLTFLTIPLLANILDPSEFGVVDISISLFVLLGLVVSLSLESAIARFWFEKEDIKSRRLLYTTSISSVSVIGILVIGVISILSSTISFHLLGDVQLFWIIIISSVVAFFIAVNSISLVVLRMERRILSYVVLSSVQPIVLLLLLSYFYLNSRVELGEVLGALLASYLLAAIVGVVIHRNFLSKKVNLSLLNELLSYSLPLVPSVFVTWFNNQVDRYLLLVLSGISVVGVFGASARVAGFIGVMVTVFQQTWLPYSIKSLYQAEVETSKLYNATLRMYMISMLSLALLFLFVSKPIVHFLYAEEYWDGFIIIPWLIGAKVLHGVSSIVNVGSVKTKKTRVNSIAGWIGAIVNLIVGIVLISRFGIIGASIGSYLAQIVSVLILIWFTHSKSDIRLDLRWFYFPLLIFSIALILFTF